MLGLWILDQIMIKNFESLEKNSIDLYSSYKSIFLQDRENKINNSLNDQDDWENLDNNFFLNEKIYFFYNF